MSDEVNELLDEARVPLAIKAASIALAAAGLLVGLLGLQNLTLLHWAGAYAFIPASLLLFGVIAIGVAAKLVRARSWSLMAALASAALLALGATGFFMLSTMSGVFTLLAVLGVGAGITALVMTVLAIGPFRRLLATRARLREAGYDLDL